MLQKLRICAPAMAIILLSSVLLVPVPAQGPDVEVPGPDQMPAIEVDPAAGFFAYSGGFVRGKRARTQTAAYRQGETPGWRNLPGATLSWSVSPGTIDLFNVAFSAECRLFGAGAGDYVRIRIVDSSGGVVAFLEPYDGAQAFCSANGYATHKGNWVRRAGRGIHNLQVQIWIFDAFSNNNLSVWLDDWTFELVVYD